MIAIRSQPQVEENNEYFLWGLGVMLFVHIVNWYGIAYWDQTNAVWFLQLALVGSLTHTAAEFRNDQSARLTRTVSAKTVGLAGK